MRSFIYLLLFLGVVTSSVYARKAVKVSRLDLLKDAAYQMLKIPEFKGRMTWASGGIEIDEFINYLSVHETKVYSLYDSERGLRLSLGKALNDAMNRDIFSLPIKADGKDVRKYFRGAKPDLQDIISTAVIADPELNAKIQWGREGLSTDEIMAAVIELYPEVRTLYVQSSTNKNERGLRTALGKALDKEMEGSVFSLRIDVDGKLVHKYFRGTKPDLQAIISTVITDPELSAKMQWGSEGLSTDDIMAAVIKLYPKVHTLYVQASTNKTELGFRVALRKALDEEMEGSVFSLQIGVDGKLVKKYFRGAKPDLQAIISTVIADHELSAKMQRGSEGLIMDEIMAAVTKLYPKVRTLYVQASANKKDHGLRIALGIALDAEMEGSVFSLRIDADDKYVRKYFLGARPDLQAIISTVIADPELSAKMQWGSEGLSTDEIMAAVTKLYPKVRTLYVQASANKKDHGFRIALGKALDGVDGVVVRYYSTGGVRYFWKE